MRAGAVLLAFGVCTVPALAQENGDLDRIPSVLQDSPAEQTPAANSQERAHGKYYVEDAFALSARNGGLTVPFPMSPPSEWANRTSLDAFDQWTLSERLSFSFSDRINLTEADGIGFPAKAVHNDLREAYLTWEPWTQTYLELGRINLKSGIALGFNPTDFFKTRTAVAQVSGDPSSLREDRLGTLMLRAQTIWDGGSLTFAYAPKLHSPTPITTTPNWIDPSIDQTNGADRFLVSVNFDLGELSPQALIYHESGRTKFGLNFSYPIGKSIITYAEWAGRIQPNLITQAIAYGKETNTISTFAPVLPPTNTSRAFRNDLAVGASWTSAEKITINLEYHFHQAGLTKQDWRNWFTIGGANPASAPELWYVRGYASAQQQPEAQHQLFIRADATDAFVKNLEVGAFSLVNLTDGSCLTQLYTTYYLSDSWTVGAYVSGDLGGERTEWGSSPSAGSAIFQVARYF